MYTKSLFCAFFYSFTLSMWTILVLATMSHSDGGFQLSIFG